MGFHSAWEEEKIFEKLKSTKNWTSFHKDFKQEMIPGTETALLVSEAAIKYLTGNSRRVFRWLVVEGKEEITTGAQPFH